jgi:glycerol-3-phosphate dehydrogenase
MQRDVSQLESRDFDLIVVGGGVYGAWAALDAAQRGLSVCLLERGDFGAATSGNSQRMIHGGLRYLQHADLRRFRQSVRERRMFMRTAPELVRPLPVLAPTMRRGLQRRHIMRMALAANDMLSLDRNRGVDQPMRIPGGRLLDRDQCEALAPGVDFGPYTGAALFHDAQLISSERHIISIVAAAASAGAVVANYVCVEDYLQQRGRVAGVQARDLLTGGEVEVWGKLVLNCAGPWTRQRTLDLGAGRSDPRLGVFKAAVLLTRDLGLKVGLALPGRGEFVDAAELVRKGYRNFFFTPWRGLTLVGTFYAEHQEPAERCGVSGEELEGWLEELNAAWPGVGLGREDVRRVYVGLLPRGAWARGNSDFQYAKRYTILDHEREAGVSGVVSVVGVKYTTARAVAEEAVSLACGKLGRRAGRCRTSDGVPILGPLPLFDAESAARALLCDDEALRSSVRRAIGEEMACTLADVALRRTELASAGYPGDEPLARCAAMMSEVLGWDLARVEREVIQVKAGFEQWSCIHAA